MTILAILWPAAQQKKLKIQNIGGGIKDVPISITYIGSTHNMSESDDTVAKINVILDGSSTSARVVYCPDIEPDERFDGINPKYLDDIARDAFILSRQKRIDKLGLTFKDKIIDNICRMKSNISYKNNVEFQIFMKNMMESWIDPIEKSFKERFPGTEIIRRDEGDGDNFFISITFTKRDN